jgi:NAD(P)-dependent dehydrogenase (short-subunit alcohol dehydrogenase family)
MQHRTNKRYRVPESWSRSRRRILVTGAAGLIGNELCSELIERPDGSQSSFTGYRDNAARYRGGDAGPSGCRRKDR